VTETPGEAVDAAAVDPHEFLANDPDLAPVVADHGPLKLDPHPDLFERLLISICRQQVSMDAAAAIRERLFDACEVTPAGVLELEEETLRGVGLSGQKVRYVREVAEAFQERGYDRAYFTEMDDDAIVAALSSIYGVGTWTARMQLMFALGREDVFPVGDLGIRKGMAAVVDPELSKPEMVEYAKTWAPYRSYASLYLWRAVEG
jgi:DNA-3-methyladenine glycosylase II